jgi:hypothetical protein
MSDFRINPGYLTNPIILDGRMRASLDWKMAREEAITQIKAGKKVVWQIDLGLFLGLDLPLSDQMQFQSLCLSLEHFRHTLWKEWESKTFGIVMYTGELDFSKQFPWDETLCTHWRGWLEDRFENIHIFNEETQLNLQSFDQVHPQLPSNAIVSDQVKLFFRDAAAEYLHLLAAHLPEELQIYLTMKISEKLEPFLFFQLSTQERFERFHLIFDSHNYRETKKEDEIKLGICLPGADKVRPSQTHVLHRALNDLVRAKAVFRVIPEDFLINQWDGLDYILYSPKALGPQGKRKLQGFCAAGGQPITVDHLLGLPFEISFKDFLSLLSQDGHQFR